MNYYHKDIHKPNKFGVRAKNKELNIKSDTYACVDSGCLIWGYTSYNGYGAIYQDKRYKTVTRIVTNCPEGLIVLHKDTIDGIKGCCSTLCVNPEHLTIGTYKINNDLALRSRLNEKTILEIKERMTVI